MKTEEYIGEVMPDGHISLPEKVAKGLSLEPYALIHLYPIRCREMDIGDHHVRRDKEIFTH